jgi:hypothetical protein
MTPKPRREGQSGGMNHTGSQARSARRGGDPGRYGGPPKKGCALVLLAGAASVLLAGAGVWDLLA